MKDTMTNREKIELAQKLLCEVLHLDMHADNCVHIAFLAFENGELIASEGCVSELSCMTRANINWEVQRMTKELKDQYLARTNIPEVVGDLTSSMSDCVQTEQA